ncbi:nucleoside 2-deoxyribosyltransferase [Caulobacter mirabilis]|uniref:Nucleoside 2-deoxyribosyltransferase n=1 Tax=Caulobacter mirabilis TaxID=69666 RepID=A0A2D2AWD4_9CAUL|nr:nucleoside 2-deoxyribosyltransferase [Caulobacter mirabilis]ATQ42306.1 nucleoside 2-deoxyribosyltransferase [Caulobacter mirabilis]
MSRRVENLYLAGPEVWYPNVGAHFALRQALCEAAGFSMLLPDTSALRELEPGEVMAREIYAERVARMRKADAAIVNLTPWRGPAADPGTAFEAGFLSGLGKPVFAWMNIPAEEDAEYRDRIDAHIGAQLDEDGVWRDASGALIEDFGLPETAMLWAEARRLFVIVTPDVMDDVTGLQLCLEAVRQYAE